MYLIHVLIKTYIRWKDNDIGTRLKKRALVAWIDKDSACGDFVVITSQLKWWWSTVLWFTEESQKYEVLMLDRNFLPREKLNYYYFYYWQRRGMMNGEDVDTPRLYYY